MALSPTYQGYISTTSDALIVIQAALNNHLNLLPRRPRERERDGLIRSGNVFVFVEQRSHIKRWTDGISWSPSRVLGKFLLYRELDKDTPKNSHSDEDIEDGRKKRKTSVDSTDPNTRQLVGSLVTSYDFKEDGLIKKTLSLTFYTGNNEERETVHLISYYTPEDVTNHRLNRPSDNPYLANTTISESLLTALRESTLGGRATSDDELSLVRSNSLEYQEVPMNISMSLPLSTPLGLNTGLNPVSQPQQEQQQQQTAAPLPKFDGSFLLQQGVIPVPHFMDQKVGSSNAWINNWFRPNTSESNGLSVIGPHKGYDEQNPTAGYTLNEH